VLGWRLFISMEEGGLRSAGRKVAQVFGYVAC